NFFTPHTAAFADDAVHPVRLRTLELLCDFRLPLAFENNDRYGCVNRMERNTMALSVEDRFASEDSSAAYAWASDTGDVEGSVACFTPDARMVEEVFEEPDIWEGHDGIRGIAEHYRNAEGFPGRQHHVSQVQYMPQEDGTVKMRSFAFVTECAGDTPFDSRFVGYYEDHAMKGEDGRWRLHRRVARLWDGEILKNFPGRGQWTPRKRPASSIIKR
ncbi:hypothetical protein OY671_008676, partial [Metschnikowia pulcherrima]